MRIFLDRVPRTASNFIDLAMSGFYNGRLGLKYRLLHD